MSSTEIRPAEGALSWGGGTLGQEDRFNFEMSGGHSSEDIH
jgi:hypothetical protein